MIVLNFQIVFICANTGEQKTIENPYRTIDYKTAKQGIKNYCMTNKSFTSVLSLRTIKFNALSVNLLKQG
tara:strand:+ start:455 stop:664 length:210 start_codon:yes stop_codon:yes gene_type:complete